MTTAPPNAMETLAGQPPVEVRFLDGSTETLAVRQLVVAQYPEAARLAEEQDEIGLVALATGLPRIRVSAMTPESYDQVVSDFYASNTCFFAYLGRRAQIRQALGLGGKSAWPSTSAGSAPRPG